MKISGTTAILKTGMALLAVSWALMALNEARAVSIGSDQLDASKIQKILEADSENGMSTAGDKNLSDALQLLNARRYDDCIELVGRFLKTSPESAPAYELLGAALVKKGRIEEGLAALKKAIALNPRQSSAMTKIGDVHMARQQYEQARQEFLKAVQIHPHNRLAHQRLGIIYEMEGDIDLAIAHYEEGIKGTPPGYMGVKVNLAKLYNTHKRFREAADLLKNVVTEDNGDATAHLVLGTSYLNLNQTDAAINEFKILQKLEPESDRSHLALGIAYRGKGYYDDSVKELEKVTKINPAGSTGYFQLGQTYARRGNYDAALASFRRAEKLSENPALIKFKIAQVYLAQKKYPSAIGVYKDLIASGVDDPKTYDLLGSALQMNGELDQAEAVFEKMQEKYPDRPFSNYRLGLFYGFSRKYEMAIFHLKKADALAPGDPLILKALAVAYRQKGDLENAVEVAEKIVKSDPANMAEKIHLATLYEAVGRDEDATALYQDVVTVEPDHVLALNNLAVIYSQKNQLGDALNLAGKAVSLAPDNSSILDTYGWILFKTGDIEKALEILKTGAESAGDNPTIFYHLGAVYQALGDNPAARESLEKALNLSQNFKEAAEAKKLLDQLN